MEKSDNNVVATLIQDYNALKKLVGDNPAYKTLLNETNKAIVFQMITKFALEKQIHSLAIIRAEPNYYNLTLEQRRDVLKAPHTTYLCKSLIMENTAFQPEYESEYYQRYYCVVIQYKTEVNSEKIAKAMRDYQNANCAQKLGKRSFHFRLVNPERSYEMTGYEYGSVTPFCLKTQLPIVLSKRINDLNPRFFYMGGGEIDLKIRVSTDEFLQKTGYNITILDIVDDTESTQD